MRLGHRGGSAPRRGGPDGPRGGVTVRERLARGGQQRAGAAIPRDDDPGQEPLVRSPATGGRSFACESVTRPARKYPRASRRIVQVTGRGTPAMCPIGRTLTVRRSPLRDRCRTPDVIPAHITRRVSPASTSTAPPSRSSSVTSSGTTNKQSARASAPSRCDGGPPTSAHGARRRASTTPRRNCRRPAGEVSRAASGRRRRGRSGCGWPSAARSAGPDEHLERHVASSPGCRAARRPRTPPTTPRALRPARLHRDLDELDARGRAKRVLDDLVGARAHPAGGEHEVDVPAARLVEQRRRNCATSSGTNRSSSAPPPASSTAAASIGPLDS